MATWRFPGGQVDDEVAALGQVLHDGVQVRRPQGAMGEGEAEAFRGHRNTQTP